jgi:hypothetical protein
MRRALPTLLLPALLTLTTLAQQSQSDAAKAKAEAKAKRDAKQAQKAPQKGLGKGAPKNLEPPQPVLAWIYPAGGRQGTTVEVALSGTGIQPSQVLVSGSGATARIVDAGDGKTARIAVEIAPGADPTVRELRVLNAGGISNRFRFAIGDLPEMKEVEPNSDKAQPQNIDSLPMVVNGQILEGDRDYFRFHAAAGETVVCEVQARGLLPFIADAVPGWFDPIVAIYDGAGKQLLYADDFRFKPDPIVFFRAPRDGDYTLELRDVIYRGRGDFIYRLKLGSPESIRPDLAPVHLPPTDLPVTPECEPNDTAAQAQKLAIPTAVEGRIQKPGDSDYYQLHVNKNDKLVMEVQARRYDSPLDSILTLYNDKAQVLAENDDWTDPLASVTTHQADSRISYTFAAAGDYTLRLRDIEVNGGDDYAYRLTIAPPKPDFALRITPDNPRLGQGDTAAISVNAVRRDEFAGEITLSVEGLPEGFVASEALIPAGQQEGRLTITAPPDAPLGVLAPAIMGVASVGAHRAVPSEAMMQAFAYIHYLPTKQLYLAVIPPAAFTISTEAKALELKPGDEVPIVVKIHRMPGVQAAVSVLPLRLANNMVVTKAAQVPPDQDTATIAITVDKDAKPGLRLDMILSAVMRAGTQTITRYARAIPVKVVAAP